MTETQRQYLHEQLITAQSKYTYFLLAAAASAIALALNRTAGEPLAWDQLPLALAVLCWGLSFFFGCRYLAYLQATLRANIALVAVQSGEDPQVGRHPQLMQVASTGIRQAAESNAEKANTNAHRQFTLLIIGALFYIGWHALGMVLRTPDLASRILGSMPVPPGGLAG